MDLTPDRIVLAAAAVAAVVYLAKGVRYIVHKVDQIDTVTKRELDHNHGGSMKDDVHGLAVAFGQMQRERDRERAAWNAALTLAAKHHPEDAALYLALRRSEPE